MKYNILGLFLWFWVYGCLDESLKEFITYGNLNDYLYGLESFNSFIVFISSNISQFLFAFLIYTGFYYFFPQKKWQYLIPAILASFIIPIIVRFLLEQYLYDFLFDYTNYPGHTTFATYARDNYYYGIRYTIYGVVFYTISYALYRERQQKGLIIENQKMQLSLLYSQTNPHFLLNSLNNIYSLVYQKSDRSLEAIDKLSGFLKYSLYENKEKVTLETELTNVDKIMELYKMRYSYPLAIQMNIQDNIGHLEIPPFMIIPLIENAFKHGDLKNESSPLLVNVEKQDKMLIVNVANNKGRQEKDKVGGIGLENIRKRLELLYPNNHVFDIKNDSDNFEVTLKIPTQ